MKIMKNATRIITTLFTLTLLLVGFAKNAYATDITVSSPATGSTYTAYKLLNATNSTVDPLKYAYTVNSTYRTALRGATAKTVDNDIVAYISALDAAGTRTFADTVFGSVKAMTPDATTTTGKFTDLAQGYYLIVETKVGSLQDSFSLVMLDTAGLDNITVETKEDVPTVMKKVIETNDTTGVTTGWQDAADYDVTDAIPFQLTGTVSTKIAEYEHYYYEFHDTLAPGTTYDHIASVYILHANGTKTPVTDYTANYVGNDLSVQFTDLKTLGVIGTDKIVVEYEANLNENAVLGEMGNPSQVYLEYSNDPYSTVVGKSTTGSTTTDKVIVFTYQLKANKIDGTTKEDLSGAGFTLYKKDSAGKYVAVGDEVKGSYTFEFKGLDAGDFKLVETTVPAGYNKVDDMIFTIGATYDTLAVEPKLLTLTGTGAFTADKATGVVTTTVANFSGVELPSTGGAGTKMLYAMGGLMVLGSVIVLVTKKRMNA